MTEAGGAPSNLCHAAGLNFNTHCHSGLSSDGKPTAAGVGFRPEPCLVSLHYSYCCCVSFHLRLFAVKGSTCSSMCRALNGLAGYKDVSCSNSLQRAGSPSHEVLRGAVKTA